MNHKFNTIVNLQATRLDDIILYAHNPKGSGKIQSLKWHPIKLSMSGQSLAIDTEYTEAGPRYKIAANLRLKEQLSWDINYGIVLVAEFCGGEIRIIGTPNIPIRLENDWNLTQKRLSFTHVTPVFPLIYTL
jgi:hypothetical protein